MYTNKFITNRICITNRHMVQSPSYGWHKNVKAFKLKRLKATPGDVKPSWLFFSLHGLVRSLSSAIRGFCTMWPFVVVFVVVVMIIIIFICCKSFIPSVQPLLYLTCLGRVVEHSEVHARRSAVWRQSYWWLWQEALEHLCKGKIIIKSSLFFFISVFVERHYRCRNRPLWFLASLSMRIQSYSSESDLAALTSYLTKGTLEGWMSALDCSDSSFGFVGVVWRTHV